MILTADWVLPVSAEPIRNGAVFVDGGRIKAVGPKAEIVARHPDRELKDHPGCVILPGLVNAHTHLSLTSLEGLVAPMPLSEWLPKVAAVTRALGAMDFADAATWGALRCLQAGITAVGDITYGPEPLAACGDSGLAGTFFWELIGRMPEDFADALTRDEYPPERPSATDPRHLPGISPHAPYTSGPDTLRAIHDFARHGRAPVAMHVAESAAELRLMLTGDGPLAEVAGRLAHGFSTPHAGVVHYLDGLGVLDAVIAIHCVHLIPGEVELLAEKARGVVLCPRSNRYLSVGDAPVHRLRAAGARLALGTDSLGSNADLDLFAEARAARALDPGLSDERLLQMLTLEAAGILGLADSIGSIEVGKHADLVVLETGSTTDPMGAVLEQGSPQAICAVMGAGTWRVLDGAATTLSRFAERANARVAEKAARALG